MGRRKISKQIRVEKIADRGLGLGRNPEGKVVFVEHAVPGDLVDVRIRKSKSSFDMGTVHELLEASSDRITAFCEHFGTCGGCRWQNLSYPKQLEYKRQQVEDAIIRLGHFADAKISDVIGCEKQRAYRNKLEFTFSIYRWLNASEIKSDNQPDRRALGFYIPKRFNRIMHLDTCYLMDDVVNDMRNFCYAHAMETELGFYDQVIHKGVLRNLTFRNNRKGEYMVILSCGKDDKGARDMLNALQREFPQIVSIWLVINPRKNDFNLDLPYMHLYGKEGLIESLLDIEFQIGPKSFFQTNTTQAEVLYKTVLDLAELKKTDLVYDLYTGIGSIALCAAALCKRVVGIEVLEAAIADAEANAGRNKINNCDFHAGKMSDMLTEEFTATNGRPDVVICDPPRAGMHKSAVQQLAGCGARRIVYVSCNPATQARDLDLLRESYNISKLQPVDMFPHTYHVENIAILDRISD